MKITKRQLRRIIREEYNAYSIENIRERGEADEMATEVHDIMNSMGPGALSGKEAYDLIWSALNTHPSDFWGLMLSPDGPIGDAIVGIRQSSDEDFAPDRPIGESAHRRELRKIIKVSLLAENLSTLRDQKGDLLNNTYEKVSSDTQYPYGRNRGDVRRTDVYKRLDNQPVPDSDFSLLQRHDEAEREAGGSMAALGGIHTTTLSDDGMTLVVKYYRHTAG